jgi:hypothetical protein
MFWFTPENAAAVNYIGRIRGVNDVLRNRSSASRQFLERHVV